MKVKMMVVLVDMVVVVTEAYCSFPLRVAVCVTCPSSLSHPTFTSPSPILITLVFIDPLNRLPYQVGFAENGPHPR